MNEDQIKILNCFNDVDSDYCYYYRYFEGQTGMSRKECKAIMDVLRESGYVEYVRGLMGEEGTAGSGFMITGLGQEVLKAEAINE